MISGLVLKYLNGECFVIRRGYETTLPVSSSFCLTVPSQSLAEPSPRVSLVQSGSFSKKTEDICKPDADSHSIFFTYYSYEQQSS